MQSTRKFFAVVCLILLALNLVNAQQLQTLDNTDSEKQRRVKTNENFQTLLDKVNQNFTTLNSKPAINGYTRAALPSNATAGTIATVSDDIGGVWLRSLAGKWYRIGGEAVSVEDYASLAAAVSSAGSSLRTLSIPSSQAVTSNLVIPANVRLDFTGSGQISVANGVTLTVQSDSRGWPLRQLFSGAGAVRFGASVEASYPQFWGAKMDGTTDDRAAAQKAIDAWSQPAYAQFAGGKVIITGPMAIASTLNIFGQSIVLTGRGGFGSAGYAGNGQQSDYIKWIGSAGSPMLLIHSMGVRVESLHFIGKSSAKPSAAIEISESGSYFTDLTCIRDVWIGPMHGADDDTGIQFTNGVLFSGSIDSDTNLLQRVMVSNAVTGINITSANSSVDHFDTIQTIGCTTGLKTVAPQIIVTNWICALNDVDLDMAAQGGTIELYNYASEGSGRMAVGSSLAPYRLVVRGGGFQADGTSGAKFAAGNADFNGKRAFIKFSGLAAIGTYIDLHDFSLTSNGTPATPIIQAWNTTDGTTPHGGTAVHVKVEACPGILSSTIDTGSDGFANSERIVEYTPLITSQVQPQQVRFVQNSGYGSEDGQLQDSRFDLLGKVNIYGGPLKVKKLPELIAGNGEVGATPTGTGATTYSYRVSALTHTIGGVIGETLASTAATCTNGTLGTGGRFNRVNWYPVHGAYAYRIYGRTSGSELLMATVTLSTIVAQSANYWDDNGSVTPSGALPSVNTTGNAVIDGSISIGNTLTLSALSGLVRANGGSAATAAVAGTDYVAPGAATSSGLTMTTARLLGRTTASTGAIEQISVGNGLNLSNGSFAVADGVEFMAATALINTAVGTAYSLYTVPSGKHFVVTKIVALAGSTVLDDGLYNAGYNGASSDVCSFTPPNDSATYAAFVMTAGSPFDALTNRAIGAAGQIFRIKQDVPPANTGTFTVQIFGYLY